MASGRKEWGCHSSPPKINRQFVLIFETKLVEFLFEDAEAISKVKVPCIEAADASETRDFRKANTVFRQALDSVNEKSIDPAEP
jgi:hypothetical protein